MSESSGRSESFDEVLARFLIEVERGADPEAWLQAYAAQDPAGAAELRAHADLQRRLNQLGQSPDEPRPERLGDFRIVREIARGGMKVIYEAVQEPLGRRVAVAVIRGRMAPAHRERFLREQRVLASLHQTHIVPIFAAGVEGEIQYFAMPYVAGAPLHYIVRTASQWETDHPDTRTPPLKELARRVVQDIGEPTRAVTGPAQPASPATPMSRPPGSTGLVDDGSAASRKLPRLSRPYFRSVAQVMADAAEAIQHAHERGVLHRDLKPANILVDTDERSWLIDFGLAGYLQTPDTPASGSDPAAAVDPMSLTRGVMGTPGYMAPEQEAGGPTDVRTDVWGLGVTLYDLLTLQHAFAPAAPGAAKRPRPASPRQLVPNVPSDLAAICLRCLQEQPPARYATAGAVAEDLRRWLRGEPTTAHPARAPRRTYLWARRNKGWASALAVSLLALVGLAAGGYWVQRARANEQQARADVEAAQGQEQRARADMAAAQAKEQRARADVEAARANEERRQSLMLQAERLLAPGQTSGWSDRAWNLEQQVVQLRKDDHVRNQAAAVLAGLDATLSATFPEFGAQAMVFDPAGQRLLMGTLFAHPQYPPKAMLWQVGAEGLEELRGAGLGPVAFGADGAPLQLTLRQEQNELALVDLSQGEVASRFALPAAGGLRFSGELAVAADGSSVAATVTGPSGQPAGILLWSAASREWLPLLPFRAAPALAFSPDGTLLAAGDPDGTIAVWSVRTGQALASLRAARNAVQSLAFGRDRRRPASRDDAETSGWLLAAGDEGGTVTIWDLARKVPRSYCRGGSYNIYAVAFSADGVTLASAGRGDTKLWDVGTGRLLLAPQAPCDGTRSLAFSPDGRRLATGGSPGRILQVSVWELSTGRGVTALRGLACSISKTCLSRDSRYLAALAHNWDVAIWDLQRGFLLHVLEAPRGISADNAALAFSPDGSRFAFSAGREAKVWDVASGRQLQQWKLFEGFVDLLAYAGPDRLLSLRTETQDGRLGPFSNAHPTQHPRVCRLRALPEQGEPQTIKEITEFNWHVLSAATPPRGQYFVVEGLGGSPGELRRLLKVFDATGQELAALPTVRSAKSQTAMHVCDPTGMLLGAVTCEEEVGEMTLFEMPSCRAADKIGFTPHCLSPAGSYFGTPYPGGGFALLRRGQAEPIVVFDEGAAVVAGQPQFDSTGTLLAWGRTDGTVAVAQLPEVQRRLAELGLAW